MLLLYKFKYIYVAQKIRYHSLFYDLYLNVVIYWYLLIIISSNPHFEVGEISPFVDEEMNE